MSDSVNYGKIKVNFNEIIKKLHQVALDFAKKKDSTILLENIAFDDKTGDFIGGGEYWIQMKKQDGSVVDDSQKGKFLDVVKEYVHYFIGDEDADYIKEDDLQPLLQVNSKTDDEDKNSEDKEKNSEDKENSSEDTNTQSANQEEQVNESYYGYNKIIKNIFESEEDQTQNTNTEENKPEEQKEQGQDKTENDNVESKCVGYTVMYDFSVQGKKNTNLQDAIKHKSRGLFGGVLSDLRNFKIRMNGKDVLNIGQIFDPAKWKEQIGMVDIDINRVGDNIQKAFNSDFPNNDLNSSSIKVWGKNALTTQLNRNGKITPEIKSKIGQADYSIVIDVSSKDPNYPDYNQKSIAKTVSKALGTSDNMVDWNAVKDKDVIKIDNIKGLYKKDSNYDKKNKNQSQNNNTNKDTSQDNKKVIKEGIAIVDEDDVAEQKLKGNKIEKSDPIETGQYVDVIKKQMDEQVHKELGGENVTSSGFSTTQDFINSETFNNYNDTKLKQAISKDSENVLYVEIEKKVQDSKLKESLENKYVQKFLRTLFEDQNIILNENEGGLSKLLKQYFEYLHMDPNNPKNDDEIRGKMEHVAQSFASIDETQKELLEKVSKVFSNSVLNTIEELKLDIKDPKFDAISTYRILQDVKESLILEDAILEVEEEIEGTGLPDDYDFKLPDDIITINGGLGAHLTEIGKKVMKNPGLHFSPYGVIHKSEVITAYMNKHNLSKETASKIEGKKEEYPYSAIVIAKRNEDYKRNVDEAMQGSLQADAYNDESINRIFGTLLKDYDVIYPSGKELIPCDDAKHLKADKKDVLDMQFIDRIKSLGYNKDTDKTIQPKLDIWICQFKQKQKDEKPPEGETKQEGDGNGDTNIQINQMLKQTINITQNNTQNNTNITNNNLNVYIFPPSTGGISIDINNNISVRFLIILKNPIKKPDPDPEEKDKKTPQDNSSVKSDWYIIPHKNLKDLSDRPHQERHYNDGTTTTKTSDAEYKP